MSRFTKWFRPDQGSSKDEGDLESQISQLVAEASRAPLGFKGTPYNRAGDLCLRAGIHDRALGYYGQAIDAMLEDGQPEPARGVAKKIIRIHPEAVRTLCTLTWLDLASGHVGTALVHLSEYVDSAIRGGRQDIATEQIFEMARTVSRPDFLDAAAEALDRLEAEKEAADVRQWAMIGGSPDSVSDPETLAGHCFQSAVGANARKVVD